jgi:putative spermidine/putrescine transport system substrate-binding protein
MSTEGPLSNTPSRRNFIQAAGAVGGGLMMPASLMAFLEACGGTSTAPSSVAAEGGKGPLIFLTWGGSFGKAVRAGFSDPFTRQTGIEVKDVTPFSYGKVQTAMTSGNPEHYDLFWFDDEVEPFRAGKAGWLEKINYNWLPNASKVVADVKTPWGVCPYIGTYQMIYRTDTFKSKVPRSWADFWNTKDFPGPRSFGTWVGGVLEAALLADGVATDKLYPLDVNRAFKKLDQIKSGIRVFHDTQQTQQIHQMVDQGDVAMLLSWGGTFAEQAVAGKPVNVVYNQGFYFSPLVGIAKGTKSLKAAHDYLNTFFDPAAELVFLSGGFLDTPAAPEAYQKMPEPGKSATAGAHLKEMVHLNPSYYVDHEAELQQRYDSWRVS